MTPDQITEKLNSIPAFCLINAEGGLVGMQGKDGIKAVSWFTDATEAKAILEVCKQANPEFAEGLRLGVHGLGNAFRMCKGWPGDDSGLQAGGKSFEGELRLQGNMPLVNEVGPKLKENLESAGINAGAWIHPIFICHQLQSPDILPIFLHPADLATMWQRAGREVDSIPEDSVVMMDIRMFVAELQTNSNPWNRVQFVPSKEAIELAAAIQGASKETAE